MPAKGKSKSSFCKFYTSAFPQLFIVFTQHMVIVLNNKQQDIADNCTLAQALQHLQLTSLNGVAIAVNNSIINKKDWETHTLQHNDVLVLIRASQGG